MCHVREVVTVRGENEPKTRLSGDSEDLKNDAIAAMLANLAVEPAEMRVNRMDRTVQVRCHRCTLEPVEQKPSNLDLSRRQLKDFGNDGPTNRLRGPWRG